MKLLLDENLPHDFRHLLSGHEVFTVKFMRWSGTENGELLARAAQSGFDALLSLDVGLGYEHNPATLPIAVVVLRSRSTRLDDLRSIVPAVLEALRSLPRGAFVRVG
jgi:predicted nuclease of predicted toxin-antitoxin system